MITLLLNKNRYDFPLKQSEISYALGKRIFEIAEEFSGSTNTNAQHWMLSAMCGCTYEEAQLVADDQLNILFENHMLFNENVKIRHERFHRVGKKLYNYRDFEKPMKVREYSDLDLLAIDKMEEELVERLFNPARGWIKLLKFLFKKHDSWNDINYFQHKLSLYHYFQWKTKLVNAYNVNSNNPEIPDDQKDGKIELTPLERYGLYHIIMELHDNDYQKLLFWLDRDIRELLKYLRYMNLKEMSKPR